MGAPTLRVRLQWSRTVWGDFGFSTTRIRPTDIRDLSSEIRKQLLDSSETPDQSRNFFESVVEVKARAHGAYDAEAAHQRLSAVMPGPNRDPVLVKNLGDIVRVDSGKVEAHNSTSGLGVFGTIEREIVQL